MSANEFVVIQVWTRYDGSTDGRWLDYSRCTAKQAQTYISQNMAESGKWRAVHWIRSEVVLTERQLSLMAEMPSQWENRPPSVGMDVGLTRRQADILSESMLNALLETDESQWTTYADALDAFCAVATPGHLEMWRDAKGI